MRSGRLYVEVAALVVGHRRCRVRPNNRHSVVALTGADRLLPLVRGYSVVLRDEPSLPPALTHVQRLDHVREVEARLAAALDRVHAAAAGDAAEAVPGRLHVGEAGPLASGRVVALDACDR